MICGGCVCRFKWRMEMGIIGGSFLMMCELSRGWEIFEFLVKFEILLNFQGKFASFYLFYEFLT